MISNKTTFTIGNRVKELRTLKGLTQDELSQASKISKSQISRLERGKRNISADRLNRLMDGLKITQAEFYDGLYVNKTDLRVLLSTCDKIFYNEELISPIHKTLLTYVLKHKVRSYQTMKLENEDYLIVKL